MTFCLPGGLVPDFMLSVGCGLAQLIQNRLELIYFPYAGVGSDPAFGLAG
jgi:hypothetical protein